MCLRQGPCEERRDERAGVTRVETTQVCSPMAHGWRPKGLWEKSYHLHQKLLKLFLLPHLLVPWLYSKPVCSPAQGFPCFFFPVYLAGHSSSTFLPFQVMKTQAVLSRCARIAFTLYLGPAKALGVVTSCVFTVILGTFFEELFLFPLTRISPQSG